MAIQDTQVPMYTKHTLFLYFSDFFFFNEKQNKAKLKITHKNMLNKTKHNTRCKCMRKEKKEKKSLHRDYTNVLA